MHTLTYAQDAQRFHKDTEDREEGLLPEVFARRRVGDV